MTEETLAHMVLAALKRPGVAAVFEALLGFEGDEFYTETVDDNNDNNNNNDCTKY